jgi:hypothetical protein
MATTARAPSAPPRRLGRGPLSSVPVPALRSVVGAVLPGLVVLAGLLTPLLVLAASGQSLVGLTEESTGYRYFYSLRILYTPDERPWLPQGQLMTLTHLGLQAVLTALGYPPMQIVPRIDLFAYAAAALPHLLTAGALVWAVRPLRSLPARLAVAMLVLAVCLNEALTWGYQVLLPDYYSWIQACALVSVGCCLRLTDNARQPSWRWAVGLGLFGGLCLGLKVTVIALAAPPVLLFLARWGLSRRTLIWLPIMGLISGAVFLLLTWLSYLGSNAATRHFFTMLVGFSAGQGPVLSFLPWLTTTLTSDRFLLVRLCLVLPLLLAVSAVTLRPRIVSAALLVGAVLELFVYWKRPEPTTLIEVCDYLLLTVVVWSVRVGAPLVRLARCPERARTALAGLLVLALAILAGASVFQTTSVFSSSFALVNATQAAVDQFTSDPPGRVAIFTLGNSHRPLTRDSAIFKGGTDAWQSETWGTSPYVRDLVPNRSYFYMADDGQAPPGLQVPVDTSPFQYILFVSLEPPETFAVTSARLREVFGISLAGFECPVQRPTGAGGTQYACRRLPDQPMQASSGEIAFAPTPSALTPGAPVAWGTGARRPLRPGEAVFVGLTGEVWRLEDDGAYVRLGGQPGQNRTVEALGAWSPSDQAALGLPVTFDGTRWIPSVERGRPVNTNPTLRPGSDGALAGWETLSRQDTNVARAPSSCGDVLELSARANGRRLGVQATLDASDLKGAPLTAVVRLRGVGAETASVRLSSAGAGNPTPDDGGFAKVPASGEWTTVVVHLEPDQVAGRRVELLIKLDGPERGDVLDVERAEVYAGRYR